MSVKSAEKQELKSILVGRDPKFWASLPKDQREKMVKMVEQTVMAVTCHESTSIYSGPIPSPEMFEKYNISIPDGANRVMSMAEEQSRHRMKLEQHTITSQSKQSAIGQVFAFVSVILLISAGCIATFLHESAIACTIFGTTVVGMGGVFAYGKYATRRSLNRKASRE